MKKLILLFSLSLCCLFANAQSNNPQYDSALAQKLGADDYGMKQYVLVILRSGSNTTTDKKMLDSLFTGHMANIKKLASVGKLVVAGPLQKNDKQYRGIFIFNVKTTAEAAELLKADPAITAKVLDAELYGWYGSAALPEYLPLHNKIEKTSF